jgi:hypothetical protein
VSDFTWFFVVVGGLVSLCAIGTGFALKDTRAPLYAKLAIPVFMVCLAAYLPRQVKLMMGLPVETTMNQLPKEIVLIQFYPLSRTTVDLWTLEPGHTRVYEVPLDPELQKTLIEAREALKEGVVTIEQGSGNATGNGKKVGPKGDSGGENSEGDATTPAGGHAPKYRLKKHTMPSKTEYGSEND